MTISQRANEVRRVPRQAKVGDRVFANFQERLTTLINVDPQAKQVDTVTVTGATNDKTYTIVIDGRNVSFTADGSATIAEIAAGLRAAINADPITRGRVSAVDNGVSLVTITANLPGQSFTLTENDAQLTLASVTTAATADAIPFGRLLITDGFIVDEVNRQGKLPKTGGFTAQVDTLTVVFVALVEYFLSITIDGTEYKAAVTANTSDTQTAQDLRDQINGVLPANTVIATESSGDLILTAEIPGATFTTGFGSSNDGASVPALTLASNKGLATSLERAAAGISVFASDEEVTTIGGTAVEYPPNAGVKALKDGQIWVESSQTPAEGDPVYVETAAGADTGKFFNTASATRVLLPNALASWVRPARADSSDNIAVLRISLP
jgi:hypothetical protein